MSVPKPPRTPTMLGPESAAAGRGVAGDRVTALGWSLAHADDTPPLAVLREELKRSSLPANLKDRLVRDVNGGEHYRRLLNIHELEALPANSSYCAYQVGCFACRTTVLVPTGCVGLLSQYEDYFFLGEGYHSFCDCGSVIGDTFSLTTLDKAIRHGPRGFITITDGKIGVLQLGSEYRLLAPGTYEWNSTMVAEVWSVNIRTNTSQLGPYAMITVPQGTVAVTYHHGTLRILGVEAERAGGLAPSAAADDASRTFFMDDPNWVHKGFLSTQMQTDRLEGNDLLSRDNVELIMVAMSHWRIVDPWLAVTQCADNMDLISEKVDKLVRATIARIVAGTCIGAGPVSGGLTRPVTVAVAVSAAKAADDGSGAAPAVDADADLAHLMQSHLATKHMAELSHNMALMGVEVLGVYVPEKRMKNDDTRQEVAKQAVIGIKAEAQRAAADASSYATIKAAQAEAEAERSRADAKAYSTVTIAKAEAAAIHDLATAHTEAGAQLGKPTDTAARLALTDKTARVFDGAKVTIFSGAPSSMPFMLTGAAE